MDSFQALINQQKRNLALPLTVHGVTITVEALLRQRSGTPPRTLRLMSPYLRGDDVKMKQVQAKLGPHSAADGVYGPFTDVLVKKFQAQHAPAIVEDGVGPQTRAAL